MPVPFGANHHAWRGDSAVSTAKRARAQRRYSLEGGCQDCGKPATDRHHKDGNTGNNIASNIAILCRRCHMIADGRLERFKATRLKPKPPKACLVCGRIGTSSATMYLRQGRCNRCSAYFKKHGKERPMVERVTRETKKGPCQTCGIVIAPLKRDRCQPCYDYWKRTGRSRPEDRWGRAPLWGVNWSRPVRSSETGRFARRTIRTTRTGNELGN